MLAVHDTVGARSETPVPTIRGAGPPCLLAGREIGPIQMGLQCLPYSLRMNLAGSCGSPEEANNTNPEAPAGYPIFQSSRYDSHGVLLPKETPPTQTSTDTLAPP